MGMAGRAGDAARHQRARELLARIRPRVPSLVEHGQTARVGSDNVQGITIVPRGSS